MSHQSNNDKEFIIDLTKKSPWILCDELENHLHIGSMRPHDIQIDAVDRLIDDIFACINDHHLPISMYKTIGTMTFQLLMLLGV